MKYFDFSETKFSWRRPINSYLKVQKIYSEIIRNKRFQLKNFKTKFLNVGCGPNANPNFINLDYLWTSGVDICWDITKGIPMKTESMECIYTEHCLEHISFLQCQKVFNDFYRVLEPEGVIRVIVPDAQLYFDLYAQSKIDKDISFPYVSEQEKEEGFTACMAINKSFRDYGHLFAYDFETLYMMLKKEGFINIKRESFMHGRVKEILIDSESRKIESLYVEAEKPKL